MKKSTTIVIFIGAVLIYVAYMAVSKPGDASVTTKEGVANSTPADQNSIETEKDSFHKEELATAQKERKRKKELAEATLQIIRCKQVLVETQVKLTDANDNYKEVNDFEFFRNDRQKREDLKKEEEKIKKLEVERDSTKAKIFRLESIAHRLR